jgi:hypothetical protein
MHAGLYAECLSLCASVVGGLESPGGRRVQAEVTAIWIGLNSEAKFNKDVAEAFIRKQLLLLPEVDAYVAKMLLQTRTQALGDFAVLLARSVKEGMAGYADVSMSLELLGKLSAASPGALNDNVLQLLSNARAASRVRAAQRAGLPGWPGLRDKADPPGFQQQVAQLFEDFARRAMANPEEKQHAAFVAQLRGAGLLNMDEVTDRMLRNLVELAVNHCLQVGLPGGGGCWLCKSVQETANSQGRVAVSLRLLLVDTHLVTALPPAPPPTHTHNNNRARRPCSAPTAAAGPARSASWPSTRS